MPGCFCLLRHLRKSVNSGNEKWVRAGSYLAFSLRPRDKPRSWNRLVPFKGPMFSEQKKKKRIRNSPRTPPEPEAPSRASTKLVDVPKNDAHQALVGPKKSEPDPSFVLRWFPWMATAGIQPGAVREAVRALCLASSKISWNLDQILSEQNSRTSGQPCQASTFCQTQTKKGNLLKKAVACPL